MNYWDQFHPQIGFQFSGCSLVLPHVRSLDKFERDCKFSLPKSYREFALAFGLGALFVDGKSDSFSSFQFAMPGFRRMPPDCDPALMTRSHLDFSRTPAEETLFAAYNNLERLQRLMIFCENEANSHDFWAWDPTDVTDAADHEYGVYQMLRLPSEDDRVLKVASTFREFVLDFCCEGKLRPDPQAGPASRRPRNAKSYPEDYPVRFGPSIYWRSQPPFKNRGSVS